MCMHTGYRWKKLKKKKVEVQIRCKNEATKKILSTNQLVQLIWLIQSRVIITIIYIFRFYSYSSNLRRYFELLLIFFKWRENPQPLSNSVHWVNPTYVC